MLMATPAMIICNAFPHTQTNQISDQTVLSQHEVNMHLKIISSVQWVFSLLDVDGSNVCHFFYQYVLINVKPSSVLLPC